MKERNMPLRQRITVRIKKMLGMNIFLCDSCQWNWRSACHNSDRPNAITCADYKKKGS